jgi:hypothetical protein
LSIARRGVVAALATTAARSSKAATATRDLASGATMQANSVVWIASARAVTG